jgi:hypothetical protein
MGEGESPIDDRRVVGAELHSMVGEDNSSSAPPLSRNLGRSPRSKSRLPATKGIGDANLICDRPISHGRRREQITKATVKCHRGHNHNACLAHSICVLLEGILVGFYLGRYVQIRNLRA